MKPIKFLTFLFVVLLASPALPCNAAGLPDDVAVSAPPGASGGQGGGVAESPEPDGTDQETVIPVVDLSPVLAAQQETIDRQGEMLAVLKSCNTLLLSLALFELFRFARGMSKRVFRKGVANG